MRRRKRVLLVDDDPGVVMSLAKALFQDNEQYDVLLAKSGEVAQQVMRELPVDVMVTDLGLPGISGTDLIYWVAAERPETKIAVITAGDVLALRDQAYRQGVLHIVQKPLHVEEVRNLVRTLLSDSSNLSGDLTRLSVVDVVQMLCLSQQTTGLQITQGSVFGVVLIEKGKVIHAVWGKLQGSEAFYEIVRAREGLFQAVAFPSDAPHTIQGDWQHLLIEGARLDDEKSTGSRPGAGVEEAFDIEFDEPSVPSSLPPPAASKAPIAIPRTQSASPTPAPRAASTGTPGRRAIPAELLTPSSASRQSGILRNPIAARSPEPNVVAAVEQGTIDAMIERGFEQLREGDYDGARTTWLEAERLAPDNHLIKMNLRKLERLAARK